MKKKNKGVIDFYLISYSMRMRKVGDNKRIFFN